MTTENSNTTPVRSAQTQTDIKVKLSRACPTCGGFDWEVVVCTQCKKIWFCLPLKTIEDLMSDTPLKISDVLAEVVLPVSTLPESFTLPTVTRSVLPDPDIIS
jgi:hypothetical protein